MSVYFTRLVLVGLALQSFSLTTSRNALQRPVALLALQQRKPRSPTSGLCSGWESVGVRARFRPRCAPRCSHGFQSLQGFFSTCLGPAFAVRPLLFRDPRENWKGCFQARGMSFTTHPLPQSGEGDNRWWRCPSECHRAGGLACLSRELPTLLGFMAISRVVPKRRRAAWAGSSPQIGRAHV